MHKLRYLFLLAERSQVDNGFLNPHKPKCYSRHRFVLLLDGAFVFRKTAAGFG
jgi:hypothetical protein